MVNVPTTKHPPPTALTAFKALEEKSGTSTAEHMRFTERALDGGNRKNACWKFCSGVVGECSCAIKLEPY